LDAEGRKSSKGPEKADTEKRAGGGCQKITGNHELGHNSQKKRADNVDGQGAVGHPGAKDCVNPAGDQIAADGAKKATTAYS